MMHDELMNTIEDTLKTLYREVCPACEPNDYCHYALGYLMSHVAAAELDLRRALQGGEEDLRRAVAASLKGVWNKKQEAP